MPDLTDDEYTVLLIARGGEYMLPIGRWRAPVLSLTNKGMMQRLNGVNYVITESGTTACAAREQADEEALRDILVGDKPAIEEGKED